MVPGLRKGKNDKPLVYDVKAKVLYSFKTERNGVRIYECYQQVLSKPKKEKKNGATDIQKCSARVKIFKDGRCEAMSSHTRHANHEGIKKNAVAKRKMIEKCEYLRENFPEDASKIPIRNIFQREIVM